MSCLCWGIFSHKSVIAYLAEHRTSSEEDIDTIKIVKKFPFLFVQSRLDCFVVVNLKIQHKLREIHKNIISSEEATLSKENNLPQWGFILIFLIPTPSRPELIDINKCDGELGLFNKSNFSRKIMDIFIKSQIQHPAVQDSKL